MRSLLPLWLALGTAFPMGAQSMIESSLLTSGASAAAGGAKAASKSIGAALSNLGKTLEQAGKSGVQSTTVTVPPAKPQAAAAPGAKPEPPREYPDPAGITVGLEREALLAKFGEPTMKTSDTQLGETWYYTPAKYEGVVVTLKEGKVSAVSPVPKKPQQTAGVVVLQ